MIELGDCIENGFDTEKCLTNAQDYVNSVLVAICTSEACTERVRSKEHTLRNKLYTSHRGDENIIKQISGLRGKKFAVKGNVKKTATFCPDCNHALYWERQPKEVNDNDDRQGND